MIGADCRRYVQSVSPQGMQILLVGVLWARTGMGSGYGKMLQCYISTHVLKNTQIRNVANKNSNVGRLVVMNLGIKC